MNCAWYKIIMRMMGIRYGSGLKLKGMPVIFNKRGAGMEFGEDVVIKSSFLSNLVGLYQRTVIVTRTEKARISIGSRVGISGATIYARESIEIGDDTNIGGNVKILDNDFHPLDEEERRLDIKEKIGVRPVKIGKDCFIGCNALILKGTELGDGCVVGAGSVVSGKFEARSVIAGNPARVIRKLGEEHEVCETE